MSDFPGRPTSESQGACVNTRNRPVLAPEDDRPTFDALRFSLASDIVELVVLTDDEVFLQTLREALGETRRLWHVPSSDKVSDLLIAGGVGILVLDAQTLREAAGRYITEIKRQFPDLVVLVAGTREVETSLARSISDGTVYRFIHKPMSPGRARLFADAAVKKYDEQRNRSSRRPASHSTPPPRRRLLLGAIAGGALCLTLGIAWLLHSPSHEAHPPSRALNPAPDPQPSTDPSLLSRASQALTANRLTAPPGDNALELYEEALRRNPADADARAGLAEVHERLLAGAENALLEERLDEASAAIDTARQAGVDDSRSAFLTLQLAKAREQLKAAHAPPRSKVDAASGDGAPAATQADQFAALATQRISEGRLIDPQQDNARFYVQEALRADPDSGAASQAQQTLAQSLLTAAHSAIDRRDFAQASSWLEAASGIAAPANIENLQASLAAAHRQADADTWVQLLKSAEERLQQDRLVEPANDSAKYYWSAMHSSSPNNPDLKQLTEELGARLVAKGRRALGLKQYEAARSWFDEAASIGYSSSEATAALADLQAALAQQQFIANVVSADALSLVKAVQPAYPLKAEQNGIEGWVELEFTVAETGAVKDVAVLTANPAGVFDQAAVRALAQWRYKPVMRDSQPMAQRARIRIRFVLGA
jgi:TonB family protein